ncbi:MAG TPA: ABC transporter transmembrane domain-containing protein, partial [Abditibacteriaceae bacterium]
MVSPASDTLDGQSADTQQTIELPVEVRARLEELGINGSARITARADLDQHGRWGERYLVATADRLVVISRLNSGDVGVDNNSKNGRESATQNGVLVDIDVPLENVSDIQSKSLVGSVALEARLKSSADSATDGNGANGYNGERIVELLRASNAHSRDLNNAARVLKQLSDGSDETDRPSSDAKWQRQTCPTCGRALPLDSAVCPFCVNKWQALRRLLVYLGPYKWMAIGNGVMSILGIALSFVPAIAFSYMVDNILHVQSEGAGGEKIFNATDPAEGYRKLGLVITVIIAASFFGAVINIVRGRWASFLGASVLHDIRSQVYTQLQRLSLSYYDKREVGAVMSRVQNDVGMLQNFLLDGAENIIISSLTIIGVVTVMLTRSWVLALAVLLPVPFVIFGTTTYWRGLMKLWRRVWHQNSSLGARLADSLNGVRVVRAFAQENREVSRFQSKSSELRDATMRVERKAAVFYPTLGFIMGLGGPLTWYVGGRQVLEGTLTYGGLTLFTVLLTRLYEPIQQLTRLVNFMTRAMTAAERVFEILDTAPEISEKSDAIAMPHVEGRVEFRDVTFGYDRYRPILHG